MASTLLRFLKDSLIGGMLIILPIWVAVALLLKALDLLELFIRPISSQLPSGVNYPRLIAFLILLAACFLIGLIVRTTLGRWLRKVVEKRVLDRIPGYKVLKGFTGQIADSKHAKGFSPVLVELEEALVPAILIERHADGRCTVFVPSAPTPAVGSIYIMTPERVHPIDAPLMKTLSCISHWGEGSTELIAAMSRTPLPAPTTAIPEKP